MTASARRIRGREISLEVERQIREAEISRLSDPTGGLYRGAVSTLWSLAEWKLSELATVNEDYQGAVDAIVERVSTLELELKRERQGREALVSQLAELGHEVLRLREKRRTKETGGRLLVSEKDGKL